MVAAALGLERPLRIGFLIDAVLARYQVRVFAGARRAARREGAALLCFQGGYFTNQASASVRFDGSFVYGFAKRPAVDGIVIVSSILASEVGVERIAEFCRTQDLATVAIGKLPGYTSVQADNQIGLRRLLRHLIHDHGYRRLAFIRGAAGNPDSQEREQVFRATLQEHRLPVLEELILPGNFVESCGKQAMRMLLDERQVEIRDVDAVVAANDQMAAGALVELARRGYRVPQDVAVVGFDDDDHARFSNPPLTTIGQPVELLGERAVELLLALLNGRAVPAHSVVDTEPILRKSCGCEGPGEPAASEPADPRVALLHALEAARAHCQDCGDRLIGVPGARAACNNLVSAVVDSVNGAQPPLQPLEQAVLSAAAEGVDPLRWHDVVSLIEGSAQRYRRADAQGTACCERLLTRARWVISEAAARLQSQQQLHTVQRANTLRLLGNALVCASDLSEFSAMLGSTLPALGVGFCCVCLFENKEPPFDRARVVALYDPSRPHLAHPHLALDDLWTAPELLRSLPPVSGVASELPHITFDAQALLPSELCPGSDGASLSIHPLTFASQPLGYVVFDQTAQLDRSWITEAVAGHLSSAIYVLRQGDSLRRAREAAETASAAKSEFLANMSHEIRTPITAVLGYLDLCLGTPLSVQQQRYLSQAQASSKALLGLVNDLLDFSKIEARKLDMEQTVFYLDEVVDQVASTFGMAAAQKGIGLVVDVDPQVPGQMVGDPLRLTQVLLNLVGNAIKFTEQGEVVFRVCWVESTDQPARLRFSVQDTGAGIVSEQVARLTRPFTQGDSSTTRRYGGTGLGLAISQRLIAMLGGKLEVRSQPGQGSSFEFEIEAKVDGHLGQPNQPALRGRELNVLVADASAAQTAAIARQLESAGLNVQVATHGEAALAIVESSRAAGVFIHLALIDVHLPDRDGSQDTGGVLSQPSMQATPVLLLAPLNAPELTETTCALPRQLGVLGKPLARTSLLRHVSEALEGRATLTPAPPGPQLEPAQVAALHGKRVLLVEDNEVSREVARGLLELAGIEVHIATNGSEAVQHAAGASYDGVLMDLHMPVMDGCAAARALRSNPRTANLPIVAMTASALAEDRERCLASGMNDHLATPVDPPHLYATLTKWLTATPVPPTEPESDRGPTSELLALRALHSAVGSTQDYSGQVVRPGPGLDTASGLQRVAGNVKVYRHLLRRFLDVHHQSGTEIRDCIARGDIAAAVQGVHALSGTAGTIGAHEVHAVAFRLERALRTADPAEQQALSVPLESALDQVLPTIQSTLARLPTSEPPSVRAADSEVQLQLARLEGLLAEFDTAALDCLEEVLPLCQERVGVGPCQLLEGRVRAYDFESALSALQALRARLAEYR